MTGVIHCSGSIEEEDVVDDDGVYLYVIKKTYIVVQQSSQMFPQNKQHKRYRTTFHCNILVTHINTYTSISHAFYEILRIPNKNKLITINAYIYLYYTAIVCKSKQARAQDSTFTIKFL